MSVLSCHPDIKPSGSCKRCVIPVKVMDGYPIVCNTPAVEEMVLQTQVLLDMRMHDMRMHDMRTHTQEHTQHTQEMLLALTNHPISCLVCERKKGCDDLRKSKREFPATVGYRCYFKDGECELQRAVEFVGLEQVGYQIPIQDKPSESFSDHNRLCILCGQSVRVIPEVRGEGVLLTNPALDPIARVLGLKVCTVKLNKFRGG